MKLLIYIITFIAGVTASLVGMADINTTKELVVSDTLLPTRDFLINLYRPAGLSPLTWDAGIRCVDLSAYNYLRSYSYDCLIPFVAVAYN